MPAIVPDAAYHPGMCLPSFRNPPAIAGSSQADVVRERIPLQGECRRRIFRTMSIRYPRVVLVAVLPAILYATAVASARTVEYKNVVTPSKLISCLAVVDSTAIECTAPYLRGIGDLDTFLALSPRGKARLGQRGDFPGYRSLRRTLRYGDTWRRPGIRCSSRTTGLTCTNRDEHGFHIQKGHVRRF